MTIRPPAGTVKAPLLLSGRRVPSGVSSQSRIDPPERPPASPKGGVRLRSQHTAACASCPSTLHTRRAPSPPRQVPAPPESGIREYSSTRSGKLISSISIGVFIILLIVLATALMPSLTGRAPNPPF